MERSAPIAAPGADPGYAQDWRGVRGIAILAIALAAALVLHGPIETVLDQAVVRAWATIFVALVVQALPFLVLGVVVSGLIATFAFPRRLGALLPSRTFLAVPVATAAGMALPAELAFLLSAPAVNPVVLVATAVAFPRQPSMVVARLLAGLATATLTSLVWS